MKDKTATAKKRDLEKVLPANIGEKRFSTPPLFDTVRPGASCTPNRRVRRRSFCPAWSRHSRTMSRFGGVGHRFPSIFAGSTFLRPCVGGSGGESRKNTSERRSSQNAKPIHLIQTGHSPGVEQMDLQELESKLLTLREAAQMLGLSERTVWEASAPRGDLATVRIGRSVRYSQTDLADYIDRHRVGGGCSDDGMKE